MYFTTLSDDEFVVNRNIRLISRNLGLAIVESFKY